MDTEEEEKREIEVEWKVWRIMKKDKRGLGEVGGGEGGVAKVEEEG